MKVKTKYWAVQRDRRRVQQAIYACRTALRRAKERTGSIAYDMKIAKDYKESSCDSKNLEFAQKRVDQVQKALDDAIESQARRRQALKEYEAQFAEIEKEYAQAKANYEARMETGPQDSDDSSSHDSLCFE